MAIQRASEANVVEDARLKVSKTFELPVADALEGMDPGAIALGINGLILKQRDGTTVEVGKVAPELPVASIAVNEFELADNYAPDTTWFFFRYGEEVVTITTVLVPDNSGNQIFSGPYTPNAAAHLLPQFQANATFNRDFVITTSGSNKLVFTSRLPGAEYNFIPGNAGVNLNVGTDGGLPISEAEKALISKQLAPTYKLPYAKISSTFDDTTLPSGQEVSAPLVMTYHKEDGGDFLHAIVYKDDYEVAQLYPDTTADDTIIGYGAGTTGGAGGETVMVSNPQELSEAVHRDEPLIIHVSGTITGTGLVYVKSNKTIIGLEGSKIIGIGFMIYNYSNVIMRYLTIEKVVTYSNIIIKELAHHIWVDHCELSSDTDHGWEYYDGLLDITKKADFVTVSNCILRDNNHAFLIGGGYESVSDIGFLHVTIYNCLFDNLIERSPDIRFGHAHVFNCYAKNSTGYCIGSVVGATVRMDNNYFEDCSTPIITQLGEYDPGFVMGEATNIYDNCGANVITTAEVDWSPPYTFTAAPASTVPELVMMKAGPDGRKVQYTTPFTGVGMPNSDKINFHATFHYTDGPVRKDVFGKPYQVGQVLANVVSTPKLFYNAKFRIGYGPVEADPISSSYVLDLPHQRYSADGDVFTFDTGTTFLKQTFVVPPGKELVSVIDLDSGNIDITQEYVLINSDFSVKNLLGWSISGYSLHVRTQGIPYYVSHRHQITFKDK